MEVSSETSDTKLSSRISIHYIIMMYDSNHHFDTFAITLQNLHQWPIKHDLHIMWIIYISAWDQLLQRKGYSGKCPAIQNDFYALRIGLPVRGTRYQFNR